MFPTLHKVQILIQGLWDSLWLGPMPESLPWFIRPSHLFDTSFSSHFALQEFSWMFYVLSALLLSHLLIALPGVPSFFLANPENFCLSCCLMLFSLGSSPWFLQGDLGSPFSTSSSVYHVCDFFPHIVYHICCFTYCLS